MGNISISSGHRHGSHRNHQPPPPAPPPQPQPQLEVSANRYVFAAATPYPTHYPSTNAPPQYYQYPSSYDHHYNHHQIGWAGGRYHYGQTMPLVPPPYVEQQKAVTIRNDVNLKKETLRLEPDEQHPGQYLVSFTFDATVAGSITIVFFAKEAEECNLTATKEDVLPPVTVSFEPGLGQKFKQPSGTGNDLLMLKNTELLKDGNEDVYPLAVKAEASGTNQNGPEENPTRNSQVTQAVFEKEKGEFKIRVVKQILWVNGRRYELQEIYGIGNTVDDNTGVDAHDLGKECVVCLSELRDTTVLPCRHMCLCSGCAKLLRFQTNRCPICRQPVERLLEIHVNAGAEDDQ